MILSMKVRSNIIPPPPQEPFERRRVHDTAGWRESGHHAWRGSAKRADPPGPGAASA